MNAMRYLDAVSFLLLPVVPSRSSRPDRFFSTFDKQMCTQSPEGLLLVAGKNNSLDLCQTICEYIEGSRWEIGAFLFVLASDRETPEG
jgi:hypothetical protein